LQGLGAAGLMSVNTALVRFTYPRRMLGRGVALISLVVAVSSAAGPTVAAAILAVAPWQWLFAVNVPIGIMTFVLSLRLLPYTPPSGHRFDLVAGGLCAAMFAALISGLNGIGHHQSPAGIAAEFAVAVLVGWFLVRRQSGDEMPILPIDLFRRPIFALSISTSVCSFVSQGIAFVSLPFYFQDVIGVSAVATGLLMTPWPAMTAVMAPIAGRLADRYPAGILGGIGLAVTGIGFVSLALLPAHPTTIDILWRVAVCGTGFGLFQSPNNRAIISSAPLARSGGAGAMQGTARLLGQSIGAALVALVFGLTGGGHGAASAILVAAAFAGIGTLTSLSRMANAVRSPAERPAAIARPAGFRGPAE
jgi:DHA2 family multidrug resistance protein-like MFS transporter